MSESFRFERKFIIPYEYQYSMVNRILSNPYKFKEAYEERIINNIYFDDYNLNSLKDNINGISIRSKYRLRWYGNKYECKKYIFEKKYKKGNVGNKTFFEIKDFNFTKNSNQTSIKSEIEKKCTSYFLKQSIKHFNPVLLNSYKRRYFSSNDKKVRITLDYEIENYKINNISHFKIPNYNKNNKMIMEIKYENNLLIDISTICKYFPFRQQRFSKFVYGLLEVN